MTTTGPVNSAAPSTAQLVGGAYNATPPTPTDGHAVALQVDSSGNLKVAVSGAGGDQNVNIDEISGAPVSLLNPLPVELSDGTQAIGVSAHPVRVDPTGTTNQPITAASLPLPTNAAAETGGNLATLAGAVTSSKVQVNQAQVAGTAVSVNNGTVDAGTQRVTIASDSTGKVAIAAGTALIGQVAASQETGTVYNGTTALTPLYSTIVASSSGATQIVAAVSSKKIRVLALQVIANAAVNVKWQSHVTPTDKTGLAYLAGNGGYVLPFNPAGWFETISGEALDINLSGNVAVGGSLTYVTV